MVWIFTHYLQTDIIQMVEFGRFGHWTSEPIETLVNRSRYGTGTDVIMTKAILTMAKHSTRDTYNK